MKESRGYYRGSLFVECGGTTLESGVYEANLIVWDS